MSVLIWVITALVALAGAVQWMQGSVVVGLLLILASVGIAPLRTSAPPDLG